MRKTCLQLETAYGNHISILLLYGNKNLQLSTETEGPYSNTLQAVVDHNVRTFKLSQDRLP